VLHHGRDARGTAGRMPAVQRLGVTHFPAPSIGGFSGRMNLFFDDRGRIERRGERRARRRRGKPAVSRILRNKGLAGALATSSRQAYTIRRDYLNAGHSDEKRVDSRTARCILGHRHRITVADS
jgi:hypothetical protein